MAAEPDRFAAPPPYQPGDTKLLRITLTKDQWWTLSERMCAPNVAAQTLEEYVNEIVRELVRHAR